MWHGGASLNWICAVQSPDELLYLASYDTDWEYSSFVLTFALTCEDHKVTMTD